MAFGSRAAVNSDEILADKAAEAAEMHWIRLPAAIAQNGFKRRMRRFLKQNAPERIVSVLTVTMWRAALIIVLIWKRTCAMQQRIPVRNLRCITSLLWI